MILFILFAYSIHNINRYVNNNANNIVDEPNNKLVGDFNNDWSISYTIDGNYLILTKVNDNTDWELIKSIDGTIYTFTKDNNIDNQIILRLNESSNNDNNNNVNNWVLNSISDNSWIITKDDKLYYTITKGKANYNYISTADKKSHWLSINSLSPSMSSSIVINSISKFDDSTWCNTNYFGSFWSLTSDFINGFALTKDGINIWKNIEKNKAWRLGWKSTTINIPTPTSTPTPTATPTATLTSIPTAILTSIPTLIRLTEKVNKNNIISIGAIVGITLASSIIAVIIVLVVYYICSNGCEQSKFTRPTMREI